MKRKRSILAAMLCGTMILSPVNAFAEGAEAIDLVGANYSYHTISEYLLSAMPDGYWRMNNEDTLNVTGTDANFMITGIYHSNQTENIVYTVVELNAETSSRGVLEHFDRSLVPGTENLEVGDLLRLEGYTVLESNPPRFMCMESTEASYVGKASEMIGTDFNDVILHELRISPFYGLGNYSYSQYTLDPVAENLLKFGDVQEDGEVDIIDVISVNKYLLGAKKLPEKGQIAADVNWDLTIDSTDSLTLLKEVVGVTTNFVEQ